MCLCEITNEDLNTKTQNKGSKTKKEDRKGLLLFHQYRIKRLWLSANGKDKYPVLLSSA